MGRDGLPGGWIGPVRAMGLRKRLFAVNLHILNLAREDTRADVTQEIAQVVDIQPRREMVRQGLVMSQAGQSIDLIEGRVPANRPSPAGRPPVFLQNEKVDSGNATQAMGEDHHRRGYLVKAILNEVADEHAAGEIQQNIPGGRVGRVGLLRCPACAARDSSPLAAAQVRTIACRSSPG